MTTPTYISGLSAYAVRNLTGTYAPTNGDETLQDVTPAEWLSSDPVGSLIGVIDAWSGGPKPTTGTTLYVHGGGHQDSANNGLYAFDFSGTTAPTGWTLPRISAVSAVRVAASYTDGRPSANHTYDGMVTADNGAIYRFGGALYYNAGFRSDCWKFTIATSTWSQLSSIPGGECASPLTLYDSASGKILVCMGGGSNAPYYYWIFDTADDTFSAAKQWPSGSIPNDDLCGAYDPTRSRGLLVGEGSAQLITVNWTAETATRANQTLTGLPSITGPSCVYDAAMDVYWVWGGNPGSAGWGTIYEIDASTFGVTSHSLTGDTITKSSTMIGSYGRFVYLANWRAIGLVADIDTPVSVIRLPSTVGVGDLDHDGPATPEQISLYLPVTGTVAQGATATVRYRESGAGAWTTGHPLYRIRPTMSATPENGTVPDAFAWPIIDLDPGTAYDVEVTITDGDASDVRLNTFTTRSLPSAAGSANKTTGTNEATIQAAFDGLVAGDVLQISAGTYAVTSLHLDAIAGTDSNPIYIRGASRTGTILSCATDVLSLYTVSNIVIENLTIQGSGVDGGTDTPSLGIRFRGSEVQTRITIRNITMTGVDRAIGPALSDDHDFEEVLVYDCTLTGNNLWTNTYIGASVTFNDDGLNLSGSGNCAFNNTLTGFGDTCSVASHSGGYNYTQSSGVHFYRNDIKNSCDDTIEVDYGFHNLTFYDNRVRNMASFLSLDPLFGGPLLYARNICINPARSYPFKWNTAGSGQFLYNNTFIGTVTNYQYDQDVAFWYQPSTGGAQQSYGFRNNVCIYRGNGKMLWLDTTDHDPVDWTHNAWYSADPSISWGSSYATLAAAQAGLGDTSPVFSGVTRRMQNDVMTVTNPWTDTITLGANASTEIVANYVPTLADGGTAKNSGVIIANITDGYSGAAPDRGAIIAGRAVATYGDRSSTSPPTGTITLSVR